MAMTRRERARRLRAQGLTFAEIGKRLGVTDSRAHQLCYSPEPSPRASVVPARVLAALRVAPGLTTLQLSHRLLRSVGTVHAVLAGLEAAGRVERVPLAPTGKQGRPPKGWRLTDGA